MASNIRLESGVPITPAKRTGRELKYPFAKMGVGEGQNDTFFAVGVKANAMHSAITRFKSTPEGAGKTFLLRTRSEVVTGQESAGPQLGVRVWRVS